QALCPPVVKLEAERPPSGSTAVGIVPLRYFPLAYRSTFVAFQPQLYPDSWSDMVKEALIRANNACELCHVKRGAERRNLKTYEKYLVYLSVCHRVFYHTW